MIFLRALLSFVVVDCAATSVVNFGIFSEDARDGGAGWIHRGLVSRAEGGSLFLDEVAELDYAAQSSLLRFIERESRSLGADREMSADVRVIASSNRDLLESGAGRREDLYYRLQVLPIRLPPLRSASMTFQIQNILKRLATETGKTFEALSKQSEARLVSYAWPEMFANWKTCCIGLRLC